MRPEPIAALLPARPLLLSCCPAATANADVAIFGAEKNAATSRRQVMWEYAAWADTMIGHWKVAADGHQTPNVSLWILLFD